MAVLYEYPGTNVLKNKFHVMDQRLLNRLESVAVAYRLTELQGFGVTGIFDTEHLKSIHAFLFRDVYEWAGRFRTVPLRRGNQLFLDSHLIPDKLEALWVRLQSADFFRGYPRDRMADELAYVLLNLNEIHPFREGNGRTQRMFVSQLAYQAGFDLDFSAMTENQMRNASMAGMRGDVRPMKLHILDGLTELDKV